MDIGRIILKEIDLSEYLLLARPCVDISNENAAILAEKARENDLDFIGIVHGRVEIIEKVQYEQILDLSKNPDMSIMIRNICTGIYKKDFLKKHNIELRANDDTIFPDLDFLWQTFIFSKRAMFLESSVCDNVGSDTIWINDTAAAFDVNRKYDYIKDVLMSDWQLWEFWKPYYSVQRFKCYFEMLHWMNEDVGWAFAERMAVDFHRSLELEEIDDNMFDPEERTALYVINKDHGFFKRFYLGKVILNKKIYDQNIELDKRDIRIKELEESLKKKDRYIEDQKELAEEQKKQIAEEIREKYQNILNEELNKQKEQYESSATFKIGKALTTGPKLMKKSAKKIMRK